MDFRSLTARFSAASKPLAEREGVVSAEGTSPQARLELFEEIVLPHLNAAYNLARWLTRNEDDARDVVQESYLRAFRFFDGYRGADAKSWLLSIVRNTCRTWQRHNQGTRGVPFDEAVHSGASRTPQQERSVAEREQARILRTCIDMLPTEFREVLVMRELEEMSYKQIAEATGLALGTVMSRLSRARKRLEECAAGRTMEAAG
jgi:RNA polymerase sigma-70 factor (ECF subfamily)